MVSIVNLNIIIRNDWVIFYGTFSKNGNGDSMRPIAEMLNNHNKSTTWSDTMNTIPIVFTFDKRIILGAAVAIKSLIDTALPTTSYNIYVYHPDIKDKNIKHFEKMLKDSNHSITFKYIDKARFKDAPINKRGSWQEIVYYRLLIPDLLPQYDKVIYSDIDV